tara:strand:+ start:104391 stop:105143 length:753 start_codon:yes stop_codon:yes gene_type:complete
MIFKPFYAFETGCASYLFGCASLGVCAVVDPLEQFEEEYIKFANEKAMGITHIFETHVHADHRSAGRSLVRRLDDDVLYCLHGSASVSFPFEALDDGQEIEIGNTLVRVLHTPGHTPESVCYLVTDRSRSSAPWFLLTGDTLFVGAVGRPDLPGQAEENAGLLFDSIHGKLLNLPDALEIYPGHFSGSLCGAGMSGKPSSTIAFEKSHNPMLSMDRETFVEALSDVPPKPADMQLILRSNQGLETEPTRR